MRDNTGIGAQRADGLALRVRQTVRVQDHIGPDIRTSGPVAAAKIPVLGHAVDLDREGVCANVAGWILPESHELGHGCGNTPANIIRSIPVGIWRRVVVVACVIGTNCGLIPHRQGQRRDPDIRNA